MPSKAQSHIRPVTDDDTTPTGSGSAPPDRPPLTRERIVATAVSYIDDNGLAGLTMRRLGQMLDVEAMSLYRYIPGKEELLDAIAATLVAQMDNDKHVKPEPDAGWQDFLQRLAHGVRRVALTHPKAFPLLASRPTEAPWIRPPLRSLDWVEKFLNGLQQEGFTDEASVDGYRAFTSFLLGHLLLEVAAYGADITPPRPRRQRHRQPPTGRLPQRASPPDHYSPNTIPPPNSKNPSKTSSNA